MEDRHLWLEQHAARIYDLLLGLPPSRAWLGDHLDEAARQLRVELAARREADAGLEALRTSAVWVQDLVLGSVDGSSSLAAFMSTTMELLECWIDVAATNGVRRGSSSALVAIVSHFSELKTELEVLKFGHSADLIEDETYAL
jgi:hypothetical protein